MGGDLWGNENDDGSDQYRGIFAITRPLEEIDVKNASVMDRYLNITIGVKSYLLDANLVQEIIMLPKITFVPNSPRFIEGVINLRGRIMPVINLKKILGDPRSPATASARILVCDDTDAGVPVGLLVDGIAGIISLEKIQMDMEAPPLSQSGLDILMGLAKRDHKLLGILDFRKIMAATSRQAEADTVLKKTS